MYKPASSGWFIGVCISFAEPLGSAVGRPCAAAIWPPIPAIAPLTTSHSVPLLAGLVACALLRGCFCEAAQMAGSWVSGGSSLLLGRLRLKRPQQSRAATPTQPLNERIGGPACRAGIRGCRNSAVIK